MRAMDWSKTPLGPVESWPQSLKSAVSILLPSKAQIVLFWGPQLVTLYNDAYRPVYGAKHPNVLGLPAAKAWSEIWEATLGPLFEGVLRTGEAFWGTDLPFILERHGFPEETFFDVSYDPVRDESGGVGGIFCIVTETTGRVVGERRLVTLRTLAACNGNARTADEARELALQSLAANAKDLPFAAIVLGADPVEARQGEVQFPIPGAGTLVVALNPQRPYDEHYRGFLELLAQQIGTNIANAQAYEQERKRAESLAELDRAKTAFFSNVSHEFRTPLTLLLGPLEDELREAQLREEPRERIELAHRNGLRLLRLVNTLLDFSRIEAGRVQASYRETDLARLTADLASSFRSAMEKAGLGFEVDCPPLAAPAWVDRDLWEKIVLNLLSNAFKHTFEGKVSVSLRERENLLELEVRDSGTGIPAAELPHIFERFRRVEGARSRSHEGTGIGLSLVQELARLHGGTISVESEEGRGSAFRVTIPAGKAHLPAERIGAAAAVAATGVAAEAFVEEALRWLPTEEKRPVSSGTRPRIIWADDNADMREYVRGLLAPHYEVEAVADGAAALEALRARGADLVLTDAMMPNVDGLELVRLLRADPASATIPALVLSARAGEEARIEGLGAGADDYLYKPFSARELLARVAALLRASELRREHRRTAQMLQESERKLQTLIANLPGMAYRCPPGPPWPLSFASEGVLELTGRSASAFMAGEVRWAECMDPEHVAMVLAKVQAAVAARRPFEIVYRMLHADGTPRWVLDRGRGIYDANGGAVAIEGFVLDLTRQREAEDALREADTRKDEFLATLAHELRNPLAPLRNALHLMRLSGAGGDGARVREIMERQVNHLVRLVDDLLEMSRITRGLLELRRERVDLSTVVRNAVETSEPLIREARHRLELSLPGEALWLEGDPVRLSQILANLLNNAAKYTPDGGTIVLAARREGGQALLSVKDNGAGISEAALGRIFEMFNRETRADARGKGGLGIGLTLSRRLAEMHGGSIEARSEGEGKGSEFVVRLPLAAPPARSAVPAPAGSGLLAPVRVLVVDDNRDAAASLGMVLEVLGAEVRLAHDGYEALDAFGAAEPAVVLLDIGMPGMDGYEVARRLRARFPDRRPALVALTGWGQEDDRRRARDAGFEHHLVKPAELEALRSLFADIERRRAHAGQELRP